MNRVALIRRPRPAGRAPGKPSVPFLGTFRESGELLCICDIACCFSRLGSLTTVLTWLRLLGSPGSCCAFATLRAVFPDWVHSPRFLPGCGRVHVQGCRDGHFVFASRLGSLSTVFTWLRSRACAGMQGLGVLALVVVAPCGFAAHVASEEAVLSSPPPGQLWGRAPTTYPPRTEALGPPSPSPCAFPHPTGHPSKNAIFLVFVPSKIRHKLRNLLRPWGPCPYHLPPRNQSPWTPLPEPLYPPPPHRASFKTRHFSSFCTR